MSHLQILFTIVLILVFITGYLLAVYNSTDNFQQHGVDEKRLDPRPQPRQEEA